MSQSSTRIRAAKHALDGTLIYPQHGQNIIYYQPPLDSLTKRLAYRIQRPDEHQVSTRSMKRLLSSDLSSSPPTKVLVVTTTEEEMNNNLTNTNHLANGHQNGDSNEAKKLSLMLIINIYEF
ncbi:unnamed protein product [Rotaria magnacalcarata]|uniref:Uncharacterized protein n=1 Tax=Rotaria magnacalcarata TaxID=392030 RepID=A0A816QBP2_9BILA|nr:unnamed protein product [Rotaria magnacalcarata]